MENNVQTLQQSFINLGKAFKNLSQTAVRIVVEYYQNNSDTIGLFANKTKIFVVQNKQMVSAASIFLILSLLKARSDRRQKRLQKDSEQQNNDRDKEQYKQQKERNNTVEDLLNKLDQNTAETVDKNQNVGSFSPIKHKHKNQFKYHQNDGCMAIDLDQQQSEDERDKIFFQVYKNYLRN